jgi:ABC-type nitrate/sulfonate/bicarbonate transport system substrate-binding protein
MRIYVRRWHARNFFLFLVITLVVLAASACFLACDRTEKKPPISAEKITIAYATLHETAIPQVAQSQGYYREEGLEAFAHLHPYGKLALQDVLDGKADFATVAETPVMFAILNGEKISIVATIQTSKKNHAIVARKDKGILTPQDLKGKKIATTLGITADYFMDAFFAAHGIARKDMTVVNLKPEKCEDAIMNGQVDAVSTFYPFLHRMHDRLGEKGITFYDEDIYTETFNLVATQEFIHANPGKVIKVLRALIKAEEFVRVNQAGAQKIVADFCGIGPDILRHVWADSSFAVRLGQSLILALEDESRWAINSRLTRAEKMPNYLDFIYIDALKLVKPTAVAILK